jgi:hypothetical protein
MNASLMWNAYDFVLHGDLQLLLHHLSDLFRHSLLYLPDVRYLVDGLLNQREALVDRLVHAGDGLQYRLKPRLLDIAAFVGALARDSLLRQRASVREARERPSRVTPDGALSSGCGNGRAVAAIDGYAS